MPLLIHIECLGHHDMSATCAWFVRPVQRGQDSGSVQLQTKTYRLSFQCTPCRLHRLDLALHQRDHHPIVDIWKAMSRDDRDQERSPKDLRGPQGNQSLQLPNATQCPPSAKPHMHAELRGSYLGPWHRQHSLHSRACNPAVASQAQHLNQNPCAK